MLYLRACKKTMLSLHLSDVWSASVKVWHSQWVFCTGFLRVCSLLLCGFSCLGRILTGNVSKWLIELFTIFQSRQNNEMGKTFDTGVSSDKVILIFHRWNSSLMWCSSCKSTSKLHLKLVTEYSYQNLFVIICISPSSIIN